MRLLALLTAVAVPAVLASVACTETPTSLPSPDDISAQDFPPPPPPVDGAFVPFEDNLAASMAASLRFQNGDPTDFCFASQYSETVPFERAWLRFGPPNPNHPLPPQIERDLGFPHLRGQMRFDAGQGLVTSGVVWLFFGSTVATLDLAQYGGGRVQPVRTESGVLQFARWEAPSSEGIRLTVWTLVGERYEPRQIVVPPFRFVPGAKCDR